MEGIQWQVSCLACSLANKTEGTEGITVVLRPVTSNAAVLYLLRVVYPLPHSPAVQHCLASVEVHGPVWLCVYCTVYTHSGCWISIHVALSKRK